MLKKIFLALLLWMLSQNVVSQIRVLYTPDMPSEHIIQINKELDSTLKLNLKDSIVSYEQYGIPHNLFRKAYNANEVISDFKDSGHLILITTKPLRWKKSIEMLDGLTNYVLGSVSIVTTYNVKDISRVVKLCMHELGHQFGLNHCKSKSCYMEEFVEEYNPLLYDYEKDFCNICKLLLKK